jgi:hypothetical protein
MASAKNKSKRQLFVMSPLVAGITEILWQVTSYREIFNVGSLPPIHGKITTLPRNHGTVVLGHGSFKVTRSQSGGTPDRAHYYGSMENVGRHSGAHSSIEADGLPLT